MRSKAPTGLPISPWVLGGVLIVCALSAVFLLPNDRTLLDRQLRDGAFDRALTTLKAIPVAERARDPRFYDLAELRLRRQQFTTNTPPETVLAQIKLACEAHAKNGFAEDFLSEILLQLRATKQPGPAFDTVRPYLRQMPALAQSKVTDTLARGALAAAEPLLSAEILAFHATVAPPTAASTLELANRWRSAGKPERALAAIVDWARSDGHPLARVNPGLARLQVDLLRELGRADEAYRAVRELYDAANVSQKETLAELLMLTARQSNRAKEALPEAKIRAEANPKSSRLWREYAELAMAADHQKEAIVAYRQLQTLEPGDSGNITRLAQLLEWNEQPGEAYDLYLRALPARDPATLERLLALNRSLYRDDELASALAPMSDFIRASGQDLPMAHLQSRVGNFDVSQKLYDNLLAARPQELDATVEYARLLLDLFEYPKALTVLQTAEKHHPGSMLVQKLKGETLIRLGRYDDAREVFEHIVQRVADPFAVRNFIYLSEATGRLSDLVSGLEAKIKNNQETSPADYLRLANVQLQLARTNVSHRTLMDGLERFPADKPLRVQAAYGQADMGNFLDAARLMDKHSDLRTDPELIRFYASLLVAAQDFSAVDKFIHSGIDPQALDTPGFWEVHALIHESNKRLAEASAFYKKIHQHDPGNLTKLMNYARSLSTLGRIREAQALIEPHLAQANPGILNLAAQVYAAAGDYKLAGKYQRQYLASNPPDMPTAWGLLGDVLLPRGDKVNAKRAYKHGLEAMLDKVAREQKRQ